VLGFVGDYVRLRIRPHRQRENVELRKTRDKASAFLNIQRVSAFWMPTCLI